MKINEDVLEKVRNNPDLRRELIFRLCISEQSFYRYIRENKKNGELTKYISIKTIALRLGIPIEMVLNPEN